MRVKYLKKISIFSFEQGGQIVELSPPGRLLSLGSFLKTTVSKLGDSFSSHGKSYSLIVTKIG
jgi:hypothetical protein